MRLLHLLDYGPRGTKTFDRLLLGFAQQGRESGWDIRFAFTEDPQPQFANELAALEVGWCQIPYPLSFSALGQVRRAFGDFRPDVTQASFFSSFEWPLLWFKLSGYTRRLVVLDHTSGVGPRQRGLPRFLRRCRGSLVSRIVDAVVPVSNYVARRDTQRVFLADEKITVVPYGLNADLYPAPHRPKRDEVRIVFVGMLVPEKGVHTLLCALHQLAELPLPPFDLRIAGVGDQQPVLEQMCRDLGLTNVSFLGYVDNVPDLFASADIAVVPSEWAEAFGQVAIEAMACGAAVITSDAGGLPEVVGDVGCVFPNGNAEALAAQLRRLIEHPEERRQRGEAGPARVCKEFPFQNWVTRQMQICEDVLTSPSRSRRHTITPMPAPARGASPKVHRATPPARQSASRTV